MKRPSLLALFVAPLVMLSIDSGLFASSDTPTTLPWRHSRALAQAGDFSAKEAFEAAKSLDMLEAWDAYLKSYPTGFYADLAQAYIKKLHAGDAAATPVPPAVSASPREPVTVSSSAPIANAAAGANTYLDINLGALAPTDPGKPAVARGSAYMGFPEKFNRYYTDPTWKPSKTVQVSPNGNGNGASRTTLGRIAGWHRISLFI